jgi:hypothetical protein
MSFYMWLRQTRARFAHRDRVIEEAKRAAKDKNYKVRIKVGKRFQKLFEYWVNNKED